MDAWPRFPVPWMRYFLLSLVLSNLGCTITKDGCGEPCSGSVEPNIVNTDVGGTTAGDVYVVGYGSSGSENRGGFIKKLDGSTWSTVHQAEGIPFSGIWGGSPEDVFAVGRSDTVVQLVNGGWNTSNVFVGDRMVDLVDVTGTSGEDVYAVGSSRGLIARFDGNTWSRMDTGVSAYLRGVWANSSTDVFAVGELGTIIHYNGSEWTEMVSGTTQQLRAIWGTAADDVYAVGGTAGEDGGVILRYDGASWSSMIPGKLPWLSGIWGSSSSDIYAVGEGALHYDGHEWSVVAPSHPLLLNVWGDASGNVFAVGTHDTIVRLSP